MSTILSLPSQGEAIAGSVARAAVAAIGAGWVAYTAWRIERLTIARLRAMSDRELREMGIVRSQIERTISAYLGGQRTLASDPQTPDTDTRRALVGRSTPGGCFPLF